MEKEKKAKPEKAKKAKKSKYPDWYIGPPKPMRPKFEFKKTGAKVLDMDRNYSCLPWLLYIYSYKARSGRKSCSASV